MGIASLAYLGIRSGRTAEWSDFAGRILGMQEVDRGASVRAWRMDDRTQRLVVSDEPGETLAFMGWEVAAREDLDRLAARLSDAGHAVQAGSRDLADRRHVAELVVTHDPAGNRVELVWQPMVADTPFVPGRPIDGFVTGAYGMGHAVLHVADAAALLPFYRDTLGFHVSDYALTPVPLYFFHVNGRHHSFALIGSGRQGFHHFMVEYANLDDVGQGYDLAGLDEGRIAYTLGRHTNDYMTSYYANTPSGFFVESGWGGRVIDPATWEPHETHVGPSFWGHERLCMTPEQAAAFRDLRLKTAAEGRRAPPVVDCPWLWSGGPV